MPAKAFFRKLFDAYPRLLRAYLIELVYVRRADPAGGDDVYQDIVPARLLRECLCEAGDAHAEGVSEEGVEDLDDSQIARVH